MVFKLTWTGQESNERAAYFGWDGSSHEVSNTKPVNSLQIADEYIEIAVVEVDGRQAMHLGLIEGGKVVISFKGFI